MIDTALDWERRSGAAFEGDKIAIVHFTWTASCSRGILSIIKSKTVELKERTKVLEVVMDS